MSVVVLRKYTTAKEHCDIATRHDGIALLFLITVWKLLVQTQSLEMETDF